MFFIIVPYTFLFDIPFKNFFMTLDNRIWIFLTKDCFSRGEMQYYYIRIIHFFNYSFFPNYLVSFFIGSHVISAMKEVIHECNSKIARTLQLHACIIYFMDVLVISSIISFLTILFSWRFSFDYIKHYFDFIWLIIFSIFLEIIQKKSLVNSD